jgi:hypothetical protein
VWCEKLADYLTGLPAGEVDADGLRFLLEAVDLNNKLRKS